MAPTRKPKIDNVPDEAELLREVEAALARTMDPGDVEGYYTTREWADIFGGSVQQARNKIRRLLAVNRMEVARVSRITPLRPNVPHQVNGFRLIRDKEDGE